MSEVVGEAVLRFTVDKTAAESGLRDVEGAAEKSGSSSGGRFSGAFKKALAVGAVGITAALGIGTALYNIGSQFDDVNDTIRVGTGKTGQALADLETSAQNVGKNVPVAFADVGPVITTLNQKLGLTGKPLEALATQFLDLGHITGTAINTDTAIGALNAFGVKGGQTSKTMDALFRVTQSTGVGFDDLTSTLQRQGPTLQQFGFSIDQSASLIGTLSKAGLDSNRTLGTMSHALATFAKAGKDPQKALGDTVAQIQGFIDKGDEAGAVNVASKVFGTKGASQFIAAIKSGKVNLDDLTNATKGNSDTITKATHDTADFSEKLQLFKNRALLKLEPVANRVFNAIGSAMSRLNKSGALKVLADQATAFAKRAAPVLARVATVIGKDLWRAVKNLAPVFLPLIKQAGRFVASLASGDLQGVSGLLSSIGNALVSFTGFLGDHATTVQAIVVGVVALVAAYKIWSLITKTVTAVQAALNLVLDANPIGIIILAVIALAAAFIYAYTHSARFRDIINEVGHVITDVLGGAVDFVKKHWPLIVSIIGGPIIAVGVLVIRHFGAIRGFVTSAISAIVGTAKDVGHWASSVVGDAGRILGFFRSLPGKIKDLGGDMFSAGKALISRLLDGIQAIGSGAQGIAQSVASAVRGAINSMIDTLNNLLEFSFNTHLPGVGTVHINPPDIGHLARGTDNWRGGLAVVGEEGPELAYLPRGSKVIPNNRLRAAGGIDYDQLAAAFARHGLGRQVTIAPVLPTGDPQAAAMAVFNRLASAGMI